MGDDNGPTAASESIGGSHPLPPEDQSRSSRELYEFGPFRLEPGERKLARGNDIVALTPKAFDTLHLLVRNSGHLLGKDEIIRTLWPDTFVEEGSLANNIFLLRKALRQFPVGVTALWRACAGCRVLHPVFPTSQQSQRKWFYSPWRW